MRNRRLLAMVLVALAGLTLLRYFEVWSVLGPDQVRTSDYTSSYVAAQSWRAGDGAHLYDRATQLAGHQALGTSHDALGLSYVNPPLSAVVAAPFSLLGYLTSYRVFAVFQLLLVALAILIAVRVAPWPRSTPWLFRVGVGLVALAASGTGELLLQAQWDGIEALGLAFAYLAWRRGWPGWAGVAIAISFGITKPHLAFGLVAFLIARGERRALGGALAATAGMVVGSVLLVGVHGTLAFASAPATSAGVSPLPTMLGLTGLVYSNLQSGTGAEVLVAVGAALAVALAGALGSLSRRDPAKLEVALAGATTLSLLCAPHLLIHDLVVLAPVLVWCVARAGHSVGERLTSWSEFALVGGWIALSQAALVDIGNTAVGVPGRLVPWLLLAVATWSVLATLGPRRRVRRLEVAVAPS
ncbi:MAG TPA: glycosyltransferase family 87 protein [Candidatus Dormibacteraeota bacterium]